MVLNVFVSLVKSKLDIAAKKTYQPSKDCLGINYWFICVLIGISEEEGKVYHEYKGETCLSHPDCKESLAPWVWPIVFTGHFLYVCACILNWVPRVPL